MLERQTWWFDHFWGDKHREDSNWSDSTREIREFEKRRIVATLLEVLVSIIMSTHIYWFCGHYFLQRNGGPIGLRRITSLAALIVKMWDHAWKSLLESEGLNALHYMRYVDDSEDFLIPLIEVRWGGMDRISCSLRNDKQRMHWVTWLMRLKCPGSS